MLVKAKVKTIGEDDIWEETFEIPKDGDSAEDVVRRFNTAFNPDKPHRELVSFELVTIDPRSDVELLLFGPNEIAVLPVERIAEFFEPSQSILLFLSAASVGSMYEIEHEIGSHFVFGALITAGQGKQFNIQANLGVEDCPECGEDATEMEFIDGGWVCPACGAVQ